MFYRGLGVESLSSTGVTLNVQQIIVIFIGIFFLQEAVNYFEYAGILLIILGAVLVTVQNAPAKRKYAQYNNIRTEEPSTIQKNENKNWK